MASRVTLDLSALASGLVVKAMIHYATLLPGIERRSICATNLLRIRMTRYAILLLATDARNKVA